MVPVKCSCLQDISTGITSLPVIMKIWTCNPILHFMQTTYSKWVLAVKGWKNSKCYLECEQIPEMMTHEMKMQTTASIFFTTSCKTGKKGHRSFRAEKRKSTLKMYSRTYIEEIQPERGRGVSNITASDHNVSLAERGCFFCMLSATNQSGNQALLGLLKKNMQIAGLWFHNKE